MTVAADASKARAASENAAASAPDLARVVPVRAGDVIGDKYVVEGVLGAGGVGVVVAARHLKLGERVAIKLLQVAAAQSEENLSRFDREARALARIRSEHVARVMDSGSLPTGEPFMVLEHLEGSDLGAVLASRGRLPVVEAVDYVVQACEAVAIAHAMGIVHRDLKPANLFLTRAPDGTPIVKVLDFGISKLRSLDGEGRDQAVTQTLSVIGSPLYMSPEQMESPRDADERSDVWSLGTILYELVAGKPPFEANTLPMLCARICTAPPTPLETYEPEVAGELRAAIERCLEKDPTKRFPSVAALALAIAPFGLPATHERGARIERIARHEGLPLDPAEEGVPSSQRRGSLAPLHASTVASSPTEIAPDSGVRRWSWSSAPPPPNADVTPGPLPAVRAKPRFPIVPVASAVVVAILGLAFLESGGASAGRAPRADRGAGVVLAQSRLVNEVAEREIAVDAATTAAKLPLASEPPPEPAPSPTPAVSVSVRAAASGKSSKRPRPALAADVLSER